jgi:hydroxymethylpyrimidine/phosphomethylpyrimidine kinase
MVRRQVDAVADDLPPAAVKTGMLATAELVGAVAEALHRHRLPNYVLDPVMVATSGDRLLDADAEQTVADTLVPLATVVTPNLPEAALLVGADVVTQDDMEAAGRALLARGATAALIKGGHGTDDTVVDVLVTAAGVQRFTHPRIATASTHGTGCTLSAAITAGLAAGAGIDAAVTQALAFVHRAILAAPGLGSGHGPLNHFVDAKGSS